MFSKNATKKSIGDCSGQIERLSRALIELTSEKRYEVAARELGIRLESEDGAVNAANIIEHELRKYLRQEGLSPVLVRPEEHS